VDEDVAVIRSTNHEDLTGVISESFSQLDGIDALAVATDEPTINNVLSGFLIVLPVDLAKVPALELTSRISSHQEGTVFSSAESGQGFSPEGFSWVIVLVAMRAMINVQHF